MAFKKVNPVWLYSYVIYEVLYCIFYSYPHWFNTLKTLNHRQMIYFPPNFHLDRTCWTRVTLLGLLTFFSLMPCSYPSACLSLCTLDNFLKFAVCIKYISNKTVFNTLYTIYLKNFPVLLWLPIPPSLLHICPSLL